MSPYNLKTWSKNLLKKTRMKPLKLRCFKCLKHKIFVVPESPAHVIHDDKEPKSMEPQDELLQWHYRLGHLPFTRMKEMMNQGTLPGRLLKIDTPFCVPCQYGKMTRRPLRVKVDAQHKTKIATQPGQVVSVDQLESSTLGFVAQLKGILSTQRYTYALSFVDQSSNMTFVSFRRD